MNRIELNEMNEDDDAGMEHIYLFIHSFIHFACIIIIIINLIFFCSPCPLHQHHLLKHFALIQFNSNEYFPPHYSRNSSKFILHNWHPNSKMIIFSFLFLIIFSSILANFHQSPSSSTSSIHRNHFHLFEDYADFEDLLALVEGKRRSEGRFPVGIFPSVIQDSPPSSSTTVRSGRIFPSPQIVQRFRPPAELPNGQIRVEASPFQSEYPPEWLALHAGGSRLHGPIRARSYRELLLHALNRAQAELSRRHRLYSAGGEKKKKNLIDGESRKKKKGREKGKQSCGKCNWRMRRATNGGKCCPLDGKNGKERIKEKLRGKSIGRKVEATENGRKRTKQGGGKVATKSNTTMITMVPMPTTSSTQPKWTITTTTKGGFGKMAG